MPTAAQIREKLGTKKSKTPGQSKPQLPNPDNISVQLRGKRTKAEKAGVIDEILDKYGIEPGEELVKMYLEEIEDPDHPGTMIRKMSDKDRKALMLELLQYRSPKLRSVEQNTKIQGNLQIFVAHITADQVTPMKVVNPMKEEHHNE